MRALGRASTVGLSMALAAFVLYQIWPVIELRANRDQYAMYARQCLAARDAERRAEKLAGELSDDVRDRLMATIEVELVSCDRLHALRNVLLGARITESSLRRIEYAVLLEASTPLGSRIEDLGT